MPSVDDGDYVLLNNGVGYAQVRAVLRERLCVHAGKFDGEGSQRELDGTPAGEFVKCVEEYQAVFSAGETDEDVVAFFNHVPAGDGSTDFAPE